MPNPHLFQPESCSHSPRRRGLAAAPLRTSLALIAAAIAALSLPPASSAAIFTVGDTSAGCSSPNLAAALFGAAFTVGEDEIRIVSDQSNVTEDIPDFGATTVGALTLVGGFLSCHASAPTPGLRTSLTGTSTAPLFTVTASSGNQSTLTLRNLDLSGVNGYRGIVIDGSGTRVNLENSSVRFSTGGVFVLRGGILDVDFNSAITSNSAGSGNGGGVLCNGAASRIFTSGIISFNQASVGGGLSMDGGCVANLRDGAWFQENTATWGGALSVNGTGSTVLTSPANTGAGIRIFGNTASLHGGGLSVTNHAAATLFDTQVTGNEAATGAGIYTSNDTIVVMDRNGSSCALGQRCSVLSGNVLSTEGNGSAVYADDGSRVSLLQTYVENNSALNQLGLTFFAGGPNTELLLEGVQYWNNHTVQLFHAEDSALITAAFVSAALNDYRSPANVLIDSFGGRATGGAQLDLRSGIHWDHQGFTITTGGVITADCMMLENASGITPQVSLVGVDPEFEDRFAGNLRLQSASPGIDYCDTTIYAPANRDLDHQLRGLDLPSAPNNLGPFDLGAFENYGGIFADGFESGNLSAWSSSTP